MEFAYITIRVNVKIWLCSFHSPKIRNFIKGYGDFLVIKNQIIIQKKHSHNM
jgi:hypothetical protein